MENINPHLPIDKTASLVVSESMEQGTEFKCGNIISSMSPLPTTNWPNPKKDDLTGRVTGRFTVIGFALWKPNNWKTSCNSARWVVRCACGRYQMLTTRAVKKDNPYNMCVDCRKNKRMDYFGKHSQGERKEQGL